MKIRQFFHEMIQDVGGAISSKRVITIVCAALVIAGFIVDLFTDLSVSEYVFNGVMYIVIAGLGFIGAERFGRGPLAGILPNQEQNSGE